MNEIEIEVIDSELPQRIVEGPLDILRGVELAGKLIWMSATTKTPGNKSRIRTFEVSQSSSRGIPLSLIA